MDLQSWGEELGSEATPVAMAHSPQESGRYPSVEALPTPEAAREAAISVQQQEEWPGPAVTERPLRQP